MKDSLIPSFLVNESELLRLLTKKEWCEWIAQVSHQKWATMSNSIRSLRGNERSWANRSGCSLKMSEWVDRSFFWANRSFAHFWAKNERFIRKTDERIPSPELNYLALRADGGLAGAGCCLVGRKLLTVGLFCGWLYVAKLLPAAGLQVLGGPGAGSRSPL